MENSIPWICLKIEIRLWSFQWDKIANSSISKKGDFYINERCNQPRRYNSILCILQQSIEYVKIIINNRIIFNFLNFPTEKC